MVEQDNTKGREEKERNKNDEEGGRSISKRRTRMDEMNKALLT